MSAYSVERMLSFIHIPKCAGTSVRRTLASIPDWRSFDAIDEQFRVKRDQALANHFPVYRIEELLAQAGLSIPFEQMTKFMIVRNPWARMVSLYRHRMKKLDLWYQGKPRNTEEDKRVARQGFIPWLLTTPHEGDSVLTKMPQRNWGLDKKGDFVVDHVLRMERLERDWPEFCGRFDLPSSALPTVNVGDGSARNYRQYYNDEARRHVARWFADDIAEWGYTF